MNTQCETTPDSASFADGVLIYTAHYDWPKPHEETLIFTQTDPLADCDYWASIGGQCFAFKCETGNSCIASLQSALRLTDLPRNTDGWIEDCVYVVWKPKTATKGVWDRWQKKWSTRTSARLATA